MTFQLDNGSYPDPHPGLADPQDINVTVSIASDGSIEYVWDDGSAIMGLNPDDAYAMAIRTLELVKEIRQQSFP
jgi:hypothetical protein